MIHVQRIGIVTVLKPQSALVGDCLNACRQQLNECLGAMRTRIVVDLSESSHVQSDGLEFLVESQQACLKQGGRLAISSPTELCADILDVSGLKECIAVFGDLRTALGDFAR